MMNYAYNSQFGVPYQQPSQFYKVIPISNKTDTSKFVAEFNGTPIYFHNQTTNEIYIKQFDVKTGVTTLQEFRRAELPLDGGNTQKDINPYENDFRLINDKIDGLRETFDSYIEAHNDEPENRKGGKK